LYHNFCREIPDKRRIFPDIFVCTNPDSSKLGHSMSGFYREKPNQSQSCSFVLNLTDKKGKQALQ